jgi:hypothetical protein
MRAWIEVLVQILPIAYVAKLMGLHWHTIKRIDQRRLQTQYGAFEARGVRRLVMDEFALHNAADISSARCIGDTSSIPHTPAGAHRC